MKLGNTQKMGENDQENKPADVLPTYAESVASKNQNGSQSLEHPPAYRYLFRKIFFKPGFINRIFAVMKSQM